MGAEIPAAIMLVLAIVALSLKDLRAVVVVAGVFSLVSCLFFLMLDAPDVALTEAAVGTGIGSVVFIWIVVRTRRTDPGAKKSRPGRAPEAPHGDGPLGGGADSPEGAAPPEGAK